MKTLDTARHLAVALSVTFAAGLLFTNVYNSVVDAHSWGHALPGSIQTARDYFSSRDPGDFYRFASPINQLISLVALALCWKAGGRVRAFCAAALVLAVLSDMFTFAYFYPRNHIMFEAPLQAGFDAVRRAQSEWAAMNWVRSAGVALNLVMAFGGLFALLNPRRERADQPSRVGAVQTVTA